MQCYAKRRGCRRSEERRRDDENDPGITDNTVGHLDGRMVVVCWTPRGNTRHVISMRKTNDREKARYQRRFEES